MNLIRVIPAKGDLMKTSLKKSSEAFELLKEVRGKKPLVHHITNYVVANETANLTLCFGALPVMAHSKEEVKEMVSFAGALNLNIGTLDNQQIKSMLIAGKEANDKGIPVILDPVGAGATTLRTYSAKNLIDSININVIRGNTAEIATLAGMEAEIRGVESISGQDLSKDAAQALSKDTGAVVAVTGPCDIITSNSKTIEVRNGHPMMGTVTGTGCMSTTAISVFNSVSDDRLKATACALACFGIAGEKAATDNDNKPGSFHVALYDAVASLNESDLEKIEINEN